MKEFTINDDGIRLHAKLDMPEKEGRCPLMILIHGFTGHMEERHIVAVQKAANEAGAAVLRVEMYGHGKSDGQFRNHTLYKWVSNALAVVKYAKSLDFVTDLYLCGHSQGGLLTMLIAGMCPDDFKAVIPLSPAWMIPDLARQGGLAGVSCYHGPVLIVQGDQDEAVPYSYAVKAAELYDHAKLVTIPGDDHCYDRHLEMVTEAVRDFLKEEENI